MASARATVSTLSSVKMQAGLKSGNTFERRLFHS